MAVRLEVGLKTLKGKRKNVKVRALLNSGYESVQPEVVMPVKLAEELGFLPNLPPDTTIEEYYSVSGKFTARKIPLAIEINLDKKRVVADVVISDFEKELLLSDATISEFGIIIEDAKLGKWRFS